MAARGPVRLAARPSVVSKSDHLGLGADHLVQAGYVRDSGDVDGVAGGGPVDAVAVARVTEDVADIRRPIAEAVSRRAPVPPGVDEPAPIGMNESAQQHLGLSVDEGRLPIAELDLPRVLPARPMLGKQTRPGLR